MGNSNAELQMQRGSYLNAMALADKELTQWFLHRLGVHRDQHATFFRFADTGSLSSRIALFGQLGDSPEHTEVAKRLEKANQFRNVLAHGLVIHAPDPKSSFPAAGDWAVSQSRRRGHVITPVSVTEIEAKKTELIDTVNRLLRLTVALPNLARAPES